MPTFNATLLFVIISFVVFMLLMKQVYFDPILKIKAEREKKLIDDKQAADNFQQTFAQLSAEYAEQLKKARQESHQLIQQARQEAKIQAQQIVSSARQSAQEELQQKIAEMADWREKTYHQLEGERKALSEAIIQKIQAGGKMSTATGRS